MKIRWLSRGPNQHPTVVDSQEMAIVAPSGLRRLTISILTFETFTRCMDFLPYICNLIRGNKGLQNFDVTIIIRNNNPKLDSTNFDNLLRQLSQDYDSITFKLFNEGLNV